MLFRAEILEVKVQTVIICPAPLDYLWRTKTPFWKAQWLFCFCILYLDPETIALKGNWDHNQSKPPSASKHPSHHRLGAGNLCSTPREFVYSLLSFQNVKNVETYSGVEHTPHARKHQHSCPTQLKMQCPVLGLSSWPRVYRLKKTSRNLL